MTTLTPDVIAAKMAAWEQRRAKMYFATKDFSATYGGQTVKFWRGESFSQSHEIPRRYPGNFVLLGEYPDWSSEAINARKRGRTKSRNTNEYVTAKVGFQIEWREHWPILELDQIKDAPADGQFLWIRKGDKVPKDHPVALSYERYFRSEAEAPPARLKRQLPPDRLKGEIPRADWIMPDDGPPPPGEAVELRASRSPVTVTLTHGARADIVSDAEVTPGHERGAFVVGTHTTGTVDVRLANTTNIASRSGTGALVMAYGYELNWVRRQREIHGSHLALVGCWHTHPTGDLIPSDADLREWSRMMLAGQEFGPAPTHAGLIVDPVRGKIAAWVVRRNRHWPNNLVCERAEVRR